MQTKNRLTDEQWRQRWLSAKDKASGCWESILEAKAPQFRAAMESNGRRHVPCPNPNHPNSRDGFRMFKDFRHTGGGICNTCGSFPDGFALLRWANGWSGKEVLEEVESYLGGHVGLHAPRVVVAPIDDKQRAKENEALRRSLNRVWLESVPVTDKAAEPARRYFSHRGLALQEMPNLMFHPRLIYHDGEKIVGRFPAIVAMVQGEGGEAVTLHRTYLTEDGRKAEVESPKKMMRYPEDRKVLGGAIRLCKPGRILAVAEGIETALAVWQGTGIPTWATVNAVMMANFVVPQGVEQLIVFSDKDRSTVQHPQGHGQEAAKALVTKTWGNNIKAMAIVPPGEIPQGEKSLDWMDMLRMYGLQGFPTLQSVRRKLLMAA